MHINPAEIRFHCRRGISELELILGTFFEQHFAKLSPDEQAQFATLLKAEDTELWDWFLNQQEIPEDLQGIVNKIQHATT